MAGARDSFDSVTQQYKVPPVPEDAPITSKGRPNHARRYTIGSMGFFISQSSSWLEIVRSAMWSVEEKRNEPTDAFAELLVVAAMLITAPVVAQVFMPR